MNATVTSIFDIGSRRADAEQRIHDAVFSALRGRCENQRIAQAQARAARNLRAGVRFGEAMDRAVLWAMYSTDGMRSPPPNTSPTAA